MSSPFMRWEGPRSFTPAGLLTAAVIDRRGGRPVTPDEEMVGLGLARSMKDARPIVCALDQIELGRSDRSPRFDCLVERRPETDMRASANAIRRQFGATQCSRLLGVDAGTIHRWSSNGVVPASAKQCVEDLARIGSLFESAGRGEIAKRWVNAMCPSLNYETPADEIRAGRWLIVIAAARDYVGQKPVRPRTSTHR